MSPDLKKMGKGYTPKGVELEFKAEQEEAEKNFRLIAAYIAREIKMVSTATEEKLTSYGIVIDDIRDKKGALLAQSAHLILFDPEEKIVYAGEVEDEEEGGRATYTRIGEDRIPGHGLQYPEKDSRIIGHALGGEESKNLYPAVLIDENSTVRIYWGEKLEVKFTKMMITN